MAMSNLIKFDFVGLLGDINSLRSALLRIDLADVLFTGKRNEMDRLAELTPDERAEIMELNAIDYVIFRFVCERLGETAPAVGV
jgi:hypothetical protein